MCICVEKRREQCSTRCTQYVLLVPYDVGFSREKRRIMWIQQDETTCRCVTRTSARTRSKQLAAVPVESISSLYHLFSSSLLHFSPFPYLQHDDVMYVLYLPSSSIFRASSSSIARINMTWLDIEDRAWWAYDTSTTKYYGTYGMILCDIRSGFTSRDAMK